MGVQTGAGEGAATTRWLGEGTSGVLAADGVGWKEAVSEGERRLAELATGCVLGRPPRTSVPASRTKSRPPNAARAVECR